MVAQYVAHDTAAAASPASPASLPAPLLLAVPLLLPPLPLPLLLLFPPELLEPFPPEEPLELLVPELLPVESEPPSVGVVPLPVSSPQASQAPAEAIVRAPMRPNPRRVFVFMTFPLTSGPRATQPCSALHPEIGGGPHQVGEVPRIECVPFRLAPSRERGFEAFQRVAPALDVRIIGREHENFRK